MANLKCELSTVSDNGPGRLEDVTHVIDRAWIGCTHHAGQAASSKHNSVRKLRGWEIERVANGETISYPAVSRKEFLARA